MTFLRKSTATAQKAGDGKKYLQDSVMKLRQKVIESYRYSDYNKKDGIIDVPMKS